MQSSFHHSRYRRTLRGHVNIDGVMFSSYSTGIAQYAMISDDGQIFVARNYRKATYRASVMIGGISTIVGDRYQTETAAIKAAIKAHRSDPEPGTKGIGETWATKLDRSIADAQKIARRHSTGTQDCNPNDQIRIHDAAMRLIGVLNKARGTT